MATTRDREDRDDVEARLARELQEARDAEAAEQARRAAEDVRRRKASALAVLKSIRRCGWFWPGDQ